MPYPSRDTDFDLFDAIRNILTPTFTVLSFAFVVPLVLKRIVEEKEEGVKVIKDLNLKNAALTTYNLRS